MEGGGEIGVWGVVEEFQAETMAQAEAGARWMQLEVAGAQNGTWGVSEAEAEGADRDPNVKNFACGAKGLGVFLEGI